MSVLVIRGKKGWPFSNGQWYDLMTAAIGLGWTPPAGVSPYSGGSLVEWPADTARGLATALRAVLRDRPDWPGWEHHDLERSRGWIAEFADFCEKGAMLTP